MIDVLHCVDLGIFAHAAANIIWEVVVLGKFGSNQDANVAALGKQLRQFERDNQIVNRWRGDFKKERLCTSAGWPKLKANGNVCRGILPFCLHLAERHLSRKHVWLCQMMLRFNQILDEEGLFLSSDAAAELKELGLRFSNLYSDFASESFAASVFMWKGCPKLHMFQHLCEWQGPEMGNPRFFWCYADEDMVGQMIKVAQSCHPKTLALLTLWKWLLGYFTRLELE